MNSNSQKRFSEARPLFPRKHHFCQIHFEGLQILYSTMAELQKQMNENKAKKAVQPTLLFRNATE